MINKKTKKHKSKNSKNKKQKSKKNKKTKNKPRKFNYQNQKEEERKKGGTEKVGRHARPDDGPVTGPKHVVCNSNTYYTTIFSCVRLLLPLHHIMYTTGMLQLKAVCGAFQSCSVAIIQSSPVDSVQLRSHTSCAQNP